MTPSTSASSAGSNPHPTDRYVMLDGARLRYRDEGQGPPVLLVHGWTLDLEMWDPQVEALRETFRLVRIDRRGYGLSSGIPDPERDATDLAGLCRHLGLHGVALIGMSQGARAALGFATAARAQVRAIVLDGPPALERSGADDDVPVGRYEELVRTQGIDAFRQEWACHPLMQLHHRGQRARALLAAMIERYPGRDLACPAANAARVAAPIRLESVIAPTLILSGELDLPTRVQAADMLATRLLSAERAVVLGAGHLPNLDNPDRYNELCRAFLVRHASSDMSY
ncbi:MAG: alpha/beta fold hydrolase [Steroidobacteraceae bacterium]